MKRLTDDLRNRIYKLCGSHVTSELERTIRELNMNTEASNHAVNRIKKGEVSDMPKDLRFVVGLQAHAWAATAQVYHGNLEELRTHIKIIDPTLAEEVGEHIYGDIGAPKEEG